MLSDLIVRQAKCTGKPYSLADFDGLYLYVSAIGTKALHFRYTWASKRERMTLGGYPALSLKNARTLREEARALLARGLNPHTERKRKRQATVLAGEQALEAVYEQWLAHRSLSIEAGRQTSLGQIERAFKKDVLPVLARLIVYDITRAHLLNIIGKVEKRGSLSVAVTRARLARVGTLRRVNRRDGRLPRLGGPQRLGGPPTANPIRVRPPPDTATVCPECMRAMAATIASPSPW